MMVGTQLELSHAEEEDWEMSRSFDRFGPDEGISVGSADSPRDGSSLGKFFEEHDPNDPKTSFMASEDVTMGNGDAPLWGSDAQQIKQDQWEPQRPLEVDEDFDSDKGTSP